MLRACWKLEKSLEETDGIHSHSPPLLACMDCDMTLGTPKVIKISDVTGESTVILPNLAAVVTIELETKMLN